MSRRTLMAVAACLLVGVCGACGAPHGTQTLDHEPDLAGITRGSVPEGLRDDVAHDVASLRRACSEVDPTVREQLTGSVGGPDDHPPRLSLADAQCGWARGTDAPLLVVGIIQRGNDRLHEARDLLDDEVTVTSVGDDALYDPQSRTVFVERDGRLWYVQLVGEAPPGSDAQRVTTAIATALVH